MPSVSLRHMHHAGDSPLAPMKKEVDPPTPIFSFCKTPEYSDIMIPNTIEGDVFIRPAAKRAFRPQSRAGKSSLHIELMLTATHNADLPRGPRSTHNPRPPASVH